MQPVKVTIFSKTHREARDHSTMKIMKFESAREALCSKQNYESLNPLNQCLVGGSNPPEKYKSKWESSPSRVENKKYLKPPPRFVFKQVFNIWPAVSGQFLALCLFYPINIIRPCLVGITSPLFQKNIFWWQKHASRTRFAFGLFWALIPYKCTPFPLWIKTYFTQIKWFWNVGTCLWGCP